MKTTTNILDKILISKREEVAAIKAKYSYKDFEQEAFFNRQCVSLTDSMNASGFGIIAEIKRKSPSAGIIRANLDVAAQGKFYEESGAAAISCLTDTPFFGGSTNDLQLLKSSVSIPILRKEFIIDEIQLFQSKAVGADAILLIAEALTQEEALHLTVIAQTLGMEVIMECHDYRELKKINDLVDIVGVNNRNLKLQKTDIQTSVELFDFIPEDRMCISESGIKTREELIQLSQLGYNGALIGESILNQSNPKEFIESLHPLNQASC